MKRFSIFAILLFSLILFFTSCSNASSYFDNGNYIRALELLEEKKGLTKEDYLLKIKSYVNLGRTDDAKESIMLYLLMAEDTDEREYAVNLYCDMDFPDILNILILKESDGLKALVLKYKSYARLGQYTEAKELLSNYLASELSIKDFATLLVAYPIEDYYTFSFFNAWYKTLAENEKSTYFSLFFYFTRTDISDELAKSCFDLTNRFDNDSYFVKSDSNRALLYKTKGFLCERLHDYYNANSFFKKSYKLNPNDSEVASKVK